MKMMDIETRLPVESSKHSDIPQKILQKFARKLVFSKFVEQCQIRAEERDPRWQCCSTTYDSLRDLHRHVATHHQHDIQTATDHILLNGCHDARWKALQGSAPPDDGSHVTMDETERMLPCKFNSSDVFPWLPLRSDVWSHNNCQDGTPGQILLFYKYRAIHNIKHVQSWQQELCQRLNLTGKIRIASEGINATVGGSIDNTEHFVTAVRNHSLFSNMADEEFKRSAGSAHDFPDGLKVGIYQEIVPMGVDPSILSHENTAEHLTVDDFHEAAKKYLSQGQGQDDAVFIDCRNFYESKIGQFKGAVCPDIRKFSYWPEYVDKNHSLFENKKVYMYCTGGIRCERGSAYLLTKGICDGVYQLEGGIHKYIEKYPEGYFRGKLFVFDERYYISSNDDVISRCFYCDELWDHYKPCTTSHCHQLVLSCTACRERGLTTCCTLCQSQNNDRQSDGGIKEECDCTKHRVRIPVENVS